MRVVCQNTCSFTLMFYLDGTFFSPPAAPSPGLGACALVGGLGAPPFCFLFFPLFSRRS